MGERERELSASHGNAAKQLLGAELRAMDAEAQERREEEEEERSATEARAREAASIL